ncbi:hypothetical protein M9194_17705 [Vibrio sp. S4M6]|uniref:HlyD family secretion protein n=1 Tax=Vibrio sinus TaxID=2946865 RepID=UPI00202A67A6|nr:biotin/lipoyl-binding protein [Vibrio sinus]MCL9783268.1 hypothetical protein [Vibrio sinus]
MKVRFMLDKQKSPTSEKGVKVAYGQAKRTGYRLRWFLLLAAILAPALLTIYWLLRPQIFTIAPGIVTYQPINIVAPESSTISEMYVQVGDTVKKGQPLFLLQNKLLEEQINYLETEIKSLRGYGLNRERNEVALYTKAKNNAEKNFSEMVAIKKKYDKYFKQGHVSAADYASVLNNYYTTEVQLSDATLQLQRAKMRGADEDYVGNLSNIVRNLQLELTMKKGLEALLLVKAPFDGQVINEVGRVGERVEASTDVMTFSRADQPPEIDAYLDAKYIEKAKVGEVATVKLPNGKNYLAKVSKPTQLALKIPTQLAKPFEGRRALMKVTLSFTDDTLNKNMLIEGMPVEVYF